MRPHTRTQCNNHSHSGDNCDGGGHEVFVTSNWGSFDLNLTSMGSLLTSIVKHNLCFLCEFFEFQTFYPLYRPKPTFTTRLNRRPPGVLEGAALTTLQGQKMSPIGKQRLKIISNHYRGPRYWTFILFFCSNLFLVPSANLRASSRRNRDSSSITPPNTPHVPNGGSAYGMMQYKGGYGGPGSIAGTWIKQAVL